MRGLWPLNRYQLPTDVCRPARLDDDRVDCCRIQCRQRSVLDPVDRNRLRANTFVQTAGSYDLRSLSERLGALCRLCRDDGSDRGHCDGRNRTARNLCLGALRIPQNRLRRCRAGTDDDALRLDTCLPLVPTQSCPRLDLHARRHSPPRYASGRSARSAGADVQPAILYRPCGAKGLHRVGSRYG